MPLAKKLFCGLDIYPDKLEESLHHKILQELQSEIVGIKFVFCVLND